MARREILHRRGEELSWPCGGQNGSGRILSSYRKTPKPILMNDRLVVDGVVDASESNNMNFVAHRTNIEFDSGVASGSVRWHKDTRNLFIIFQGLPHYGPR